jgi:hypothetical protein
MESEIASSSNSPAPTGLAAREKIGSLCCPETLSSARFFDDRAAKTLIEAERKLMVAILEDAIQCFQDNFSETHSPRKRLFNDAHRWIFAVKNDWVFSFENICGVWGFEPGYVRKGLAQWREKETSKHRRAA